MVLSLVPESQPRSSALYDEGNLADDRDLKAYAMNYGIEVDSLESLSS